MLGPPTDHILTLVRWALLLDVDGGARVYQIGHGGSVVGSHLPVADEFELHLTIHVSPSLVCLLDYFRSVAFPAALATTV